MDICLSEHKNEFNHEGKRCDLNDKCPIHGACCMQPLFIILAKIFSEVSPCRYLISIGGSSADKIW